MELQIRNLNATESNSSIKNQTYEVTDKLATNSKQSDDKHDAAAGVDTGPKTIKELKNENNPEETPSSGLLESDVSDVLSLDRRGARFRKTSISNHENSLEAHSSTSTSNTTSGKKLVFNF